MKTGKSKRIVCWAFILSWLLLMPATEASFARGKMTGDWNPADKPQVEEIEHGLREEIQNLSLLEQDLYHDYASMTSFQARERFEVLRCLENMARAKGVCTYVANMLEQFLLVKEDRVSYYSSLKKVGAKGMKTSLNQYLANMERARARITDKSVLSLIDKTLERLGSLLDLLNRVIEVLEEDSRPIAGDAEIPNSGHRNFKQSPRFSP